MTGLFLLNYINLTLIRFLIVRVETLRGRKILNAIFFFLRNFIRTGKCFDSKIYHAKKNPIAGGLITAVLSFFEKVLLIDNQQSDFFCIVIFLNENFCRFE